MTILETKNYRLCTITKLVENGFEEQPVKYGLAIQKTLTHGDTWYSVMLIKPNEKEGRCDIESVVDRILDVEANEWNMVRELVKCGCDLVRTAVISKEVDW